MFLKIALNGDGLKESDVNMVQVVDKHLSILAKQHIETRFIKIQAEKSPFLAEKLKIVVLPTIALIKNAKVDDYVVCGLFTSCFLYLPCIH